MGKLLEWDDSLSVGIQEIDEQHKVLVVLLNELHEAITSHHGREHCGEVLNRLIEYTRIHFAVEESLMRILHYPGYEVHKAEHEALINQAMDIYRRYTQDNVNISIELLYFLKSWLGEHIIKSDKEYAPHFLAMGVKKHWMKESWLRKLFHHRSED